MIDEMGLGKSVQALVAIVVMQIEIASSAMLEQQQQQTSQTINRDR